MQKIAIQGIKGSFHHIASENIFGKEIILKTCFSFLDIPKSIFSGQSDFGIMAIENSIAGAILPNYALIDTYNLKIIGEYYLQIHHHFMALKGQKITDIKQVFSHPMALLQCTEFLEKYPEIKLVEDKDTAYAAEKIAKENLKNTAAIAPVLAAKMYDLEILAPNIQTIKQNYTRFFVLAEKEHLKENPTKASLKFILKHKIGSLGNILNIFSAHQVNLSKIQSLPIMEKPWEYAFFVDLIFEDFKNYQNALLELKNKVSYCKVLGVYQKNIFK